MRASFVVVVTDTFGFGRMLTAYGFTAHFAPVTSGRTTVRMEIAAVLNRLVMRRKFRRVVAQLLDGLRALAEQRHAGSVSVNRPH